MLTVSLVFFVFWGDGVGVGVGVVGGELCSVGVIPLKASSGR